MRWAGFPGRIVGSFCLFGLVALGLACWPSAFLDRGASESVRVSVFPLVLTLLDPFVWTSVVNSLVVAGLVASGSLVIGVILATVGVSWKFRGRSTLWALAMVPMAAGPLLMAVAMEASLGGARSWEWLAARSLVGYALDDLVRWAALVWVGWAWGSPIVALAIASSFRKIEPVWLEAARGTGASPGRIWSEIVWPNLRPEAARASASVFTMSLVEPAGPLILGLHRTLSAQMVRGASRFDQPTHLAGLALMAIAIVWIVRTLMGWWGGPSFLSLESSVPATSERVGFGRAMLGRLVLMGWGIVTVGPLGFVLLKAFQSLGASGTEPWLGLVRLWLDDQELRQWVINSATTASIAVLVVLIILRCLINRTGSSGDRGGRVASRFLVSIPPLALGVGALATPWLLEALADSVGGPLGWWIHRLVVELNPGRSPGWILILALVAVHWPTLFRVGELAKSKVRTVEVDASRLMGNSDRRSAETGWGGLVPGRVLVLSLVLSATNLAPALLLTPFSERRTLAPAILDALVRDRTTIDPRIASVILVILCIRLVGFAVASRTRIGSLGDWYRG